MTWTFYRNADCTGDSTTDKAYAHAHGFKTYTSTTMESPFPAGTCILIDAHDDRAVPKGSSKHPTSTTLALVVACIAAVLVLTFVVIGIARRKANHQ